MPSQPAPLQAIFFRDFKHSYIPQILEETYIKKVYQPFVTGRTDMTIVDIGANIGLTSFYFKDYAKRVYAVEPALAHQEVIDTLIKHNHIENIEIVPLALSNENGTTKFFHPENVTMYSMENVTGATDFEEVETVTMTELMKHLNLTQIDLLKLDPEGSESKIIASPEFAACAPQIKVIVGEWHNWTEMNQTTFMNRLRDLGYDFKWRMDTDAQVYTAVRT
jgi:FkbM family methyltransferase